MSFSIKPPVKKSSFYRHLIIYLFISPKAVFFFHGTALCAVLAMLDQIAPIEKALSGICLGSYLMQLPSNKGNG